MLGVANGKFRCDVRSALGGGNDCERTQTNHAGQNRLAERHADASTYNAFRSKPRGWGSGPLTPYMFSACSLGDAPLRVTLR